MNILLGDVSAKVGMEDIFKPTICNESLYKISDNNGVRVVYFAKSENLSVRNTQHSQQSQHS
jgi:hypothetical protein